MPSSTGKVFKYSGLVRQNLERDCVENKLKNLVQNDSHCLRSWTCQLPRKTRKKILSIEHLFHVTQGEGTYFFGVDPVGIAMTVSCVQYISWMLGYG